MEKKLLLNGIFFTKRKKLLNKKFKRKNAKSKYKKICLKIFLLIFVIFLIIFIISLYKRFIRKKTKVCLCAILKDENKYIIHYVEHYKNSGYEHMYI